ncbi:Hypothetical protein SMAX5B_014456 [Scophthalmus maximus]|uniref:Uncharacterized protein n=1 Tax=Scophthalmus maximus TaxID=52904 RepID=A0A2U9C2S2_SCOMX|nr:Hypothetical protein SMAX5B_014456 [Scophthalmus maximus]
MLIDELSSPIMRADLCSGLYPAHHRCELSVRRPGPEKKQPESDGTVENILPSCGQKVVDESQVVWLTLPSVFVRLCRTELSRRGDTINRSLLSRTLL